jgi:hypothetical protein
MLDPREVCWWIASHDVPSFNPNNIMNRSSIGEGLMAESMVQYTSEHYELQQHWGASKFYPKGGAQYLQLLDGIYGANR